MLNEKQAVQSLQEKDQNNVWHHMAKYNDNKQPMIAEEAKGS